MSLQPAGWQFRDAVLADVDSLVALIESAYRGETSRAGWTTEADLLDGHRTDAELVGEVVGGPDSRMLVVEKDGRIIGCCQLERGEAGAYFGMFAVAPTGQRRGLGSAILARAETMAHQEWGASQLRMTVLRQREDLIAWYLRRGYRRTGEMSAFPYGDERFGRPKRDDLEFEVLCKRLGGPSSAPRSSVASGAIGVDEAQ